MAFRAAQSVRCAGEQGKYWEMHDRLFSDPQALERATTHAKAVGLDVAKFDACMSAGKFDADIRKDMAQAKAAGVTGTPSFFLAVTDQATSRLKPLRFLRGAQPFANFKAQIDAVLAAEGGAPPSEARKSP